MTNETQITKPLKTPSNARRRTELVFLANRLSEDFIAPPLRERRSRSTLREGQLFPRRRENLARFIDDLAECGVRFADVDGLFSESVLPQEPADSHDVVRNSFCHLDDAAERVGRDLDAAFPESRLEILEPRIGRDWPQFKTTREPIEGGMGILGHPSQQVRLRSCEDVSDLTVVLEGRAHLFLEPSPVERLNLLKLVKGEDDRAPSSGSNLAGQRQRSLP